MPSTKTKALVGAKGAKALVRYPVLRRTTVRATRPAAKLGWVVVKRRARGQLERVGEAARTVGETVVIYGPPAAQVLGLVEAPKPRRTVPAFAVGTVIGAGAVYLLEPEHGSEHRRRIQTLLHLG